jgi:hypothetical protein
MDREFTVSGIDRSGDSTTHDMDVTLTEYYETINFNLGVPDAVAYSGAGSAISTPAPSGSLVAACQLGSNVGEYVYYNGDYTRDSGNDPILAYWSPQDGTPMLFNIGLQPSAISGTIQSGVSPSSQLYNYYNLPSVGDPWVAETNSAGQTVYYVAHNSDTYTYYCGPDSVFYKYNNGTGVDYHITPSDMADVWVPPGNTGTPATGLGYTAYVWQWFYLCLDSSLGPGKQNRLLMRVNPSQDGVAVTVGTSGLTWINNTWSTPPGPNFASSGITKMYQNLVVGINDYTATPPGFVGANVMGDGVNIGVAYGSDAPSGTKYVNYSKRVKGHYCVYTAASTGAQQFMRFPFWLML